MDGFCVWAFCFWVRFVRGFGVKKSTVMVAAVLVSGGLLAGCAGAEVGVCLLYTSDAADDISAV